jgi:hypothetical protein
MVARPTRKRMYRTMQGRMVDIEKLRTANESVRAVGNMNVNARGDVLGPGGTIITPKSEVIAKYYEQPRGKVDETVVKRTPTAPKKVAPVSKTMTPVAKKTENVTTVFKPKVTEVKKEETAKKGIDAALDGIE